MEQVRLSVDCASVDLLQKVLGVLDENMNVLANELDITFSVKGTAGEFWENLQTLPLRRK